MRPRDVALALAVVLLWGVNFVVIKLGLPGVSPFVLGGKETEARAPSPALLNALPGAALQNVCCTRPYT